MLNLLNNAINYSPSGEVTLKIETLVDDDHGCTLKIEVSDAGIGIAPDALAHIFEPFYRAEQTRKVEGTGLGLAIVAKLVDLMNGRIDVTSRVGHGSTFVVLLPVQIADPAVQLATPMAQHIIGHRGRTRLILIADDAQASRAALKQYLQSLGFQVIEASNGAAALQLAVERRPDLIFMDLVMPELDGFEAARRLRALESTDRIPIVALSASAVEDTAELSSINGCNAFLGKPLRFEQVITTLERQLGIEWIYANESATPQPGVSYTLSLRNLIPAPHELSGLMELAQHGDVMGIAQLLDRLREDAGGHTQFTSDLQAHVNRYDMQAIREYLRPIVQ